VGGREFGREERKEGGETGRDVHGKQQFTIPVSLFIAVFIARGKIS
jgi:hypothetical protein